MNMNRLQIFFQLFIQSWQSAMMNLDAFVLLNAGMMSCAEQKRQNQTPTLPVECKNYLEQDAQSLVSIIVVYKYCA